MRRSYDLSPEAALTRWFPGTQAFRDCQREAVARVWAGRSSLVLMPTGMGKSLVFQLPVLASGTIGLIISPLIALMRQQADMLRSLGANVLSLGGREAQDAQEELRRFPWTEGPGFLFVSPERAETDGYLEHVLRRHRQGISLVAVDEAHCISRWGHDFRPPYKSIPGFLDRVFGHGSWPAVVCLSATLDRQNQSEVLTDFRLGTEDVVRSPNMLRTNLALAFRVFESSEQKLAALDTILEENRSEKLIVYTHLKHNRTTGTRALTERFRSLGHRCAPFDADMPIEEKDTTLFGFANGEVDIVFATGAFGMGVDISDIRGVVHFLLPESLEQYYQEVGRAGRDGDPAFGVLLHTAVNAKVRRDMIRRASWAVSDVRGAWEGIFDVGRSSLRTVTPWTEFQNKDDVHALFYAFQRVGALTVLARGPSRLHCFAAGGPAGAVLLERLSSATRTGTVAGAIRKLGLEPAATMEKIFELYDSGELRLTRAPDKTLLYETRALRDEEVQSIVDDVADKVQRRLAGFDSFAKLVEMGVDPTRTLHERFGES